MARGRHREPTRRPRPRVALIAAATLLVIAPAADLGLIAGSEGGLIDSVIMRTMDGMFAFPFVLLAMLLATIFGTGLGNATYANPEE